MPRFDPYDAASSGRARHSPRAGFAAGLLWAVILLGACGQVITRPTPTPPAPTATLAVTLAATQRPTATPAPYTPEPTATPTVTPTPIIYTIRSGDTLLAIANRFGISVAALQDTNGILDPRSLRVGQELVVPAPSEDSDAGVPATPTPIPVDYTIEHLYFAETALGGLWCLGDIHNTSSDFLEQAAIEVSLLDKDGQVLATVQGESLADMIEPGDVAPFALLFNAAPVSFANYTVRPLRGQPAYVGSYYRDLEIRNSEGSGERFGAYTVRGQVLNVGPEDALDVSLVVTLYDNLNRVIGARRAAPEYNVIPRGGHADFEIDLVPATGPVARFSVLPQARRVPPENRGG